MPAALKERFSINHQQSIPLSRFVYYWLPVIGYGILIFYLSSLEIRIQKIPFPHYDKVLHLVEYGIFAWLWYRALRVTLNARPHGWIWPMVFVIFVLFAALDEVYQSINPARDSDLYDFIADILGAFSIMMIFIIKDSQRTKT